MSRTMNVLSLSRAIGATVHVSFPVALYRDERTSCSSLGLYCKVLDVRKVYGRIDLLVQPESGTGKGWVSLERVERSTNDSVCGFEALATV